MINGIAQHMLKWRNHPFEDAAIQVTGGFPSDKLHRFAQLSANLTCDSFQAWHHALKRHHARARETVSQSTVQTRLLRQ